MKISFSKRFTLTLWVAFRKFAVVLLPFFYAVLFSDFLLLLRGDFHFLSQIRTYVWNSSVFSRRNHTFVAQMFSYLFTFFRKVETVFAFSFLAFLFSALFAFFAMSQLNQKSCPNYQNPRLFWWLIFSYEIRYLAWENQNFPQNLRHIFHDGCHVKNYIFAAYTKIK